MNICMVGLVICILWKKTSSRTYLVLKELAERVPRILLMVKAMTALPHVTLKSGKLVY